MRIPRPVHEKRDPAKAELFKRGFLGHLARLNISGRRPVKIWFADESRYGLLPNLRRVWTSKGLRPHKKWRTKYERSYLALRGEQFRPCFFDVGFHIFAFC